MRGRSAWSKRPAKVAEALARVLRLTEDKRAYLFGLAGLVLPGRRPRRRAPPSPL
ncbi:hypothetical protein [Streptomyces deccanensis]|uniref:hypothetical protein n=1 Tax=Streptomyces deccanensis TaxID=424188 RepID=UPI001EFC2B04|nr:hypothetical protein [Streptomyces deccanensis]ULR54348.1 hypothetical protein L3078_36485 [Streptomyces deccanensis]